MTRTLPRPLKGLTFLLLFLTCAAPARGADGVEVGKLEVHPPVPGYIGQSLREMIATELLSSTTVPACHPGERCRWRLDGEIRKDEGFDVTLHLIEIETGKDAGELELRAASEGDLPGAVASLPPRLAQLMKPTGQKEPPVPSIASTAPEPPSRLHPDRLVAEMEAGKGKAPGMAAPVAAQTPKRTMTAPGAGEQEDDSAYVPDYPIPEEPVAVGGAKPVESSAQRAKSQGESAWSSIIRWPLGLFHGKEEQEKNLAAAPPGSNPREPQRTGALSTPPYPTPDEVFAPHRREPIPVEGGEGESPVWKRVLGWPMKLFTRAEAGGAEVQAGPQDGGAGEKTPAAAAAADTPEPQSKEARPPAPRAKGPIWQWY